MLSRTNANQLVLRRDTATGFTKVNWAAEMPLGRFEHIDVICESDDCAPISTDNPYYYEYQQACAEARKLNKPLLASQRKQCIVKGWLTVPLNLDQHNSETGPDEFGCYQKAAMQVLFHLTANVVIVWAVIHNQSIVHIESARPPKPMEEFEYQVWKHHVLSKLSGIEGITRPGKLVVNESGLWFCIDNNQSNLNNPPLT